MTTLRTPFAHRRKGDALLNVLVPPGFGPAVSGQVPCHPAGHDSMNNVFGVERGRALRSGDSMRTRPPASGFLEALRCKEKEVECPFLFERGNFPSRSGFGQWDKRPCPAGNRETRPFCGMSPHSRRHGRQGSEQVFHEFCALGPFLRHTGKRERKSRVQSFKPAMFQGLTDRRMTGTLFSLFVTVQRPLPAAFSLSSAGSVPAHPESDTPSPITAQRCATSGLQV